MDKRKRFGVLAALVLAATAAMAADWADEEEATVEYPFEAPLGIPKPKVPASNPVTPEKVELGKMLYFDKRLSADGTISCASCHNPRKGWTDQAAVSTGIRGQKGGRSAPTVLNSALMETQFWDGRAPSLEEQAKGPVANPVEMGNTHEAMISGLRRIKAYKPLFEKAFGRGAEITVDTVAQAIAAFERTILTGNAPYDRFEAGDASALSASAQRGLGLFFGKANCSVCHSGPNFSDSQFHNIGVGMTAQSPDWGRHAVSGEDRDKGAFKTPMLRNLAYTAPYMHDGSETTLMGVIDYYDKGGQANQWLSSDIRPLKLTPAEKEDLVAFLDALNGDKVEIEEPKNLP